MLTDSQFLVIQTGGTIDKEYPRKIGGYAFEIGEPATKRIIKRIVFSEEYCKFVTACTKDSQDIKENELRKIVSCCEDPVYDRILITHGTDTMIETGLQLNNHGFHSKYIVLTGALKPEVFKESDADFNVGFAFGALVSLTIPGVYIAMNCKLIPVTHADRCDKTGAFILKLKS